MNKYAIKCDVGYLCKDKDTGELFWEDDKRHPEIWAHEDEMEAFKFMMANCANCRGDRFWLTPIKY